jgi:aryl-alcohol dehydrogenase-like predicted oxidoreductase
MEKRRFGRTEHMSSVAIFGAVSVGDSTQDDADRVIQSVLDAGVNHFDVAPSYGLAEQRVGPWMPKIRDQIFLGCKTMERTKAGAEAEMLRSLERLQVSSFDLYQFHAITKMDDLDQITAPGGALEAVIEARAAGLTRFIGITGHGLNVPTVFLEALRRFDFDSVLFPINFILYENSDYRAKAGELIHVCRQRDVGTMIIKSVARGPWGDKMKNYRTWYQPFDKIKHIQPAVDFALSQDITGLCTVGDPGILPIMLDACENYTPVTTSEQDALMASASDFDELFMHENI